VLIGDIQKFFSQFRFKSSSALKLKGRNKVKRTFYYKKLPTYRLDSTSTPFRAELAKVKWKRDLF